MAIMPAAFLGHGSPVNTLEDNRYTRAWKAFGKMVRTNTHDDRVTSK